MKYNVILTKSGEQNILKSIFYYVPSFIETKKKNCVEFRLTITIWKSTWTIQK